jgi:hypothetical protein
MRTYARALSIILAAAVAFGPASFGENRRPQDSACHPAGHLDAAWSADRPGK